MVRQRSKTKQYRQNRQKTHAEDATELARCRIVVLGIGGAGNNTVDRLVETGVNGARCIAVNTDLKELDAVRAVGKILIGEKVAHGAGTGGDPSVGEAAITESKHQIDELLHDVDVVFVAAGLGGGTGTAVAPIVAEMARRKGAVVVGVVTIPSRVEKERIECAAFALNRMRSVCDTVVVVDSNKVGDSVPNLPMREAFKIADQVLTNMIKGVVESMSVPSFISLDLADFRTIVQKGGVAMVGVGESDAPNRAEEAVRNALSDPLLDTGYVGAKGAFVHVLGDEHLTVEEVNRVGEIVSEKMGRDALVKWGAKTSSNKDGFLKVTLVMTGVDSPTLLSGLGIIAPKLYDIESSCSEPEKPLQIDLGLDQIEDFEE